ncbi:MAG: acylphosphatase [Hyphomicrobiaceae bacterium]
MADADRRTVRLRIEGHVQGVGFRAWVVATAGALGLDGWVANRRDGGVEAVIAGPQDKVAAMIQKCHSGPVSASVAMVKEFNEAPLEVPGFTVRPTR